MMADPTNSDALELHVEDFGPIAKAEIDLRPLTVLVGPSNTGKSYLAMLIYALHRFNGGRILPFRLNPDRSLTIENPAALGAIAEGADELILDFVESVEDAQASPTGGEVVLSRAASEALRSGFAKRVNLLADEIGRCFGINDLHALARRRKKVARVALRPRVSHGSEPLEHVLAIGASPELAIDIPPGLSVPVEHEPGTPGAFLDMLKGLPKEAKGLSRSLAWSFFVAAVLPRFFGSLRMPAYYLPADRTGLMHAHEAVVGGLIASAPTAGQRPAARTPMLSGVVADFLEQLLQVDRVGRELDLGKSIEQAILGGSVRIERSPNTNYPYFAYRPQGWQEDLALTNASSMVSEVAPVVLYLRHLVSPENVLILEEPESHLHPAMQVEFIQQLTHVVNEGVRLIVTTHSEWLTEELANIVQRSKLPEGQRKGPALTPDQVGVWLFEQKNRPKGSVVKEIPLDADGMYPTGFDEVAMALHNDWAGITSQVEDAS